MKIILKTGKELDLTLEELLELGGVAVPHFVAPVLHPVYPPVHPSTPYWQPPYTVTCHAQ